MKTYTAVKRTGVQWDDEFIITGGYNYPSELPEFESVPGPGLISGKQFCTVDGRRFYRYDCYTDFSPYGWHEVDVNEDLQLALKILRGLDYGQRIQMSEQTLHDIDSLLAAHPDPNARSSISALPAFDDEHDEQ